LKKRRYGGAINVMIRSVRLFLWFLALLTLGANFAYAGDDGSIHRLGGVFLASPPQLDVVSRPDATTTTGGLPPLVVTASAAASFDVVTIVKSHAGAHIALTDCVEFVTSLRVEVPPGESAIVSQYGKNCGDGPGAHDSFPFSLAPFRVLDGDVTSFTQRARFINSDGRAFFRIPPMTLNLADGGVTLPYMQNDGKAFHSDVAVWNAGNTITTLTIGTHETTTLPHSFQLVPVADVFSYGDVAVKISISAGGDPKVYVLGFVNSAGGGSPDVVPPVRDVAPTVLLLRHSEN
jgi:hypothetical protein